MKLAENQIKHLIDRFLGWRLPDNFNPDNGISFEKIAGDGGPHPFAREPSGTNLFDATQANAMVRHMLEGMPEPEMPDWPPRSSAFDRPEGYKAYGTTGQLFVVQNRQWVRVSTGEQ